MPLSAREIFKPFLTPVAPAVNAYDVLTRHPMRLVAFLCVAALIGACASGSHSNLQDRSAQVSGVYELCGGLSRHCDVQKRGSVAVLDESHHMAASLGFAKNGRFDVWLVPGRYTLVATNSSGVRRSRTVEAVAGKTTTANIMIGFP